jgi:hypothetical protein
MPAAYWVLACGAKAFRAKARLAEVKVVTACLVLLWVNLRMLVFLAAAPQVATEWLALSVMLPEW